MYWLTMLPSYRFHRFRAVARFPLLLLLSLASCQTPKEPAAPAADFNTLLQKGDYAGAIAFVNAAADIPANEKDGVIGTLILDGLVDPKATTKPPYKLGDGFDRLERAVVAGRTQSVADLRAKFSTGINYEGKNSLMPANEDLAKCWSEVESGSRKPPACIEMRKSLHVPPE